MPRFNEPVTITGRGNDVLFEVASQGQTKFAIYGDGSTVFNPADTPTDLIATDLLPDANYVVQATDNARKKAIDSVTQRDVTIPLDLGVDQGWSVQIACWGSGGIRIVTADGVTLNPDGLRFLTQHSTIIISNRDGGNVYDIELGPDDSVKLSSDNNITGDNTFSGETDFTGDVYIGGTLVRSERVSVATGAGFDLTGATDSSAAFQALIDAASASALVNAVGHSTVVIPSYAKLKVGGIVPKSRVHVVSSGGALVSNGDVQGIITNRTAQADVTRFWVTGVEFVGDGQSYQPTGSSSRHGAIHIYNCSDIKIRDCQAHGFSDHGFILANAQDVQIQNNVLYDVGGGGGLGNVIHVGLQFASFTTAPQSTSRIVITGNVVRNAIQVAPICVQTMVHDAEVTGTVLQHNVVIADNPYLEVVAATATGFAAIALECGRTDNSDSTGDHLQNVHIHHNHCKVIGTNGSNPYNGIQISDNNNAAGANGSTASNEMAYITVDHNTIDSTGGGISAQASDIVIDHNIIRATTGSGITCSYNLRTGHVPTRIHIDNNIINMLDSSGVAKTGIRVFTTTATRIMHNHVAYSGSSTSGPQGGIYLTSADNADVIGNRVVSAPRHGIYFDTCDTLLVLNNRILDGSLETHNTYDGIYFNACTAIQRTMVAGNDILERRSSGNRLKGGIGGNAGNARLWIVNNSAWGVISGPIDFTSVTPGRIRDNSWAASYPQLPATVSPGVSPWTYTNSDPWAQEMFLSVSGGSISSVVKVRNSTSITTGITSGPVRLENGEQMVVTYSGTLTAWKSPIEIA